MANLERVCLLYILLCLIPVGQTQPTADVFPRSGELSITADEMFQQIAEINGKVESLAQEVAHLKSDNVQLKSDNVQLKSDNIELKTDKEKQGQWIAQMRTTLTNLTEEGQDSAVAFSVQLSKSTNYVTNETIEYDSVLLNEGGHYSTTTGVFICPTTAVYFFSGILMTQAGQDAGLSLIRHDGSIEMILAEYHGRSTQYATGTAVVVMECNVGDSVYVKAYTNSYLHGTFCTFTGYRVK